ncbi:hypothetical protein T10_10449 [Trichinella papuae]|uniref:Uncharacterized protein n=1 Tax=Trichinella papuae TaxID=268474 RepID=A0A0V1M956_9BILA|nr:hypothetical protein T10_10449 [Trichinella papuae]
MHLALHTENVYKVLFTFKYKREWDNRRKNQEHITNYVGINWIQFTILIAKSLIRKLQSNRPIREKQMSYPWLIFHLKISARSQSAYILKCGCVFCPSQCFCYDNMKQITNGVKQNKRRQEFSYNEIT